MEAKISRSVNSWAISGTCHPYGLRTPNLIVLASQVKNNVSTLNSLGKIYLFNTGLIADLLRKIRWFIGTISKRPAILPSCWIGLPLPSFCFIRSILQTKPEWPFHLTLQEISACMWLVNSILENPRSKYWNRHICFVTCPITKFAMAENFKR